MMPLDAHYDRDALGPTLARMETKLDQLLTESKEHDHRIMVLEKFRWWLLGALGLGSSGGAVLATKLLEKQ